MGAVTSPISSRKIAPCGLPAATLLAWARYEPVTRAVASQPFFVQVAEIVVVADLFQYGIHRLFHRVPLLWRVHAVHHSSEKLDWLAGSRLHIIDIVVVRAVTFAPLFVAGFSESSIRVYAVLVALNGVFLHANLRFRFGALEKVFATPRHHALHHAADAGAVDKNFAFHLPIIDRIFGTQYLPERAWPARYGLEGRQVPDGWWNQLIYPLKGMFRALGRRCRQKSFTCRTLRRFGRAIGRKQPLPPGAVGALPVLAGDVEDS